MKSGFKPQDELFKGTPKSVQELAQQARSLKRDRLRAEFRERQMQAAHMQSPSKGAALT